MPLHKVDDLVDDLVDDSAGTTRTLLYVSGHYYPNNCEEGDEYLWNETRKITTNLGERSTTALREMAEEAGLKNYVPTSSTPPGSSKIGDAPETIVTLCSSSPFLVQVRTLYKSAISFLSEVNSAFPKLT